MPRHRVARAAAAVAWVAAARALAPARLARELALNRARHDAEVAQSLETWGPPVAVGAGGSPAWSRVAACGDDAIYRSKVARSVAARVVAEAEAHWASPNASRTSRFTMVDDLSDVHVEDLPWTKSWLADFVAREVGGPAARVCGATRLAIYDALVIKYDGAGAGQPVHRDYGEATLNVALNDACEYAGGGTRFEASDATLRLDAAGDCALHASRLRHAGAALERGTRYVLVCFLVDAAAPDDERVCHARATEAHRRGTYAAALRASEAGLARSGASGELHKTAGLAARALAARVGRRTPRRAETAAALHAAARAHLDEAAARLPNSVSALHARANLALHDAETPAAAARAVDLARRALDAARSDAERRAPAADLALANQTLAFLERRRDAKVAA